MRDIRFTRRGSNRFFAVFDFRLQVKAFIHLLSLREDPFAPGVLFEVDEEGMTSTLWTRINGHAIVIYPTDEALWVIHVKKLS